MKFDEKDLAFIQDLTTAPQKNITLYSVLESVLEGSEDKRYYGCILYPNLEVAVTQKYTQRQEALDAASQEAQEHGSHLWSLLFLVSDYFNAVLAHIKGTPDQSHKPEK